MADIDDTLATLKALLGRMHAGTEPGCTPSDVLGVARARNVELEKQVADLERRIAALEQRFSSTVR